MKSFLKSLFVLLLATAAALCGCAGSTEDNTVNIAYFPNITHSQAIVGRAQGVFEEYLGEDYGVEYSVFNAGPALMEAMLAGHVDIGYIGPVPAINGYVRSDGDVLIISGCSDGGAVLVARASGNISGVADLSGKRVAVPQLGNTQHLTLLKLLSDNGLEPTSAGGTVDVYAIANSEIKTLMQNGELDAALVPEPWGARLVEEIGAAVVLDYDEIWADGGYSTAVVAVRKDFLDAHPDAVQRFLKAHSAVTDSINADVDSAMNTVNGEIKALTGAQLSASALKTAFSRLTFTCRPARESIMEFFELSRSQGFTENCENPEGIFADVTE